jgi:hypothetical protein
MPLQWGYVESQFVWDCHGSLKSGAISQRSVTLQPQGIQMIQGSCWVHSCQNSCALCPPPPPLLFVSVLFTLQAVAV